MNHSGNIARGLPALFVGLMACLATAYGFWFQPSKLPDQYRNYLSERLADYEEMSSARKEVGLRSARELAGDIDIVYRRVLALESGSPERMWEQALYEQAHAQYLQSSLSDSALSLTDTARAAINAEKEQFASRADENIRLLAAGQSEFRFKSQILIATKDYQVGMEQFGVRNAPEICNNLEKTLESYGSLEANLEFPAAKLSLSELLEAYLLLSDLAIEAAWQTASDSRLVVDRKYLDVAEIALSSAIFQDAPLPRELENYRAINIKLVSAFREGPTIDLESAEKSFPVAIFSEEINPKQTLANVKNSALDANWQQAVALLSNHDPNAHSLLRNVWSRTVCRLAVAPTENSDSQWMTQAAEGIDMATGIAPYLPELAELLWRSAVAKSGMQTENVEPKISGELLKSIGNLSSPTLKHSIYAIAAAREQRQDAARNHVELIVHLQGNLSLVSRALIWQLQQTTTATEDGRKELINLLPLMESVAEREPNSGLNWFALGFLQSRCEKWDDSLRSLDRAEKLLGELPAIGELVSAAKQKLAVIEN